MRQHDVQTGELEDDAHDYPTHPYPRPLTNRRLAATGTIAALLVIVLAVAIFASFSTHGTARVTRGPTKTTTPAVTLQPTTATSPLQAPRRGAGLPKGVEVIAYAPVGADEGWGTGGVGVDPMTGVLDHGMVRHYAAGSWAQVGAALPGAYLGGIDMISPSEGWVMGIDGVTDKHLLLHILNGAWQQVAPPTVDPQGTPAIMAMRTPDEGWLVMSNLKGAQGGANTSLLHYSGGVWSLVDTPLHYITDIAPVASAEAWVIGWNTSGTISSLVHVQGESATVALTSPSNSTFSRLRMFAPDDIWIEGAIHAASNVEVNDEPLDYHFNGAAWSKVDLHAPRGVQHIGIVASSTAWSYASIGSASLYDSPYGQIASIYSNASGQWQALGVPYKDLQSLEVVSGSSTDVWATGVYMVTTQTASNSYSGISHYVLLHYTGGIWTEYGR